MDSANFNTIIKGKEVSLHKLFNDNIVCYVTNYGARVVGLSVRDKKSELTDVVLGFNSIVGYLGASEQYHGAIVGRFANRVANGKFVLEDQQFQLVCNSGTNSLHGGVEAFHNQVWKILEISDTQITMEYVSADMEEGFPGELTTQVIYELKGSDLVISYRSISSKDTVINLTHHSYFNLNGEGSGSILQHELKINAEYYTPVNCNTIPTGKLAMVSETAFDFTKKKQIGEEIGMDDIQLERGNGYDHNFVVNHYKKDKMNFIAEVIGDQTEIKMEVWSTEPGVQFYTASHLDGEDVGKSGRSYSSREAFCLETQHFPDSPNQSHFPSVVLKAQDVFQSQTEYRFSIM